MTNLPIQRWLFLTNTREAIESLISEDLDIHLASILLNRKVKDIDLYINPENSPISQPIDDFPNLSEAITILTQAINCGNPIGICGDYDTDGMTSTALLMRAFEHLGGKAIYKISSRLAEGYGINERIVREFASEGVKVLVTVDNGITAYSPIALAKELGMSVIITDHHEVPPNLPPADVILNPKLIDKSSPYSTLAGVGVAYILAISLVKHLGKIKGIADKLLELFTLGTVADMVPLTGVNRRFVRKGLRKIANSKLAGIQALIEVSGINENLSIKPDDIGFKLAPYINAVGRIDNPKKILDLFLTDDENTAYKLASQARDINSERQEMMNESVIQAISEVSKYSWKEDKVLVICNKNWHPGIVGLIASKLVEKFNVPSFVVTFDSTKDKLKGSARGIKGFDVFQALQSCKDILLSFGGHPAAGGFSLPDNNLSLFRERLSLFAKQSLTSDHLIPLIELDGHLEFSKINLDLIRKLEAMQPWGMGNKTPVFWSRDVKVLEQKQIKGGSLRLKLQQQSTIIQAIAWQWGDYYPLPEFLDFAYKVEENVWNGKTHPQLNIVGARLPNSKKQMFQLNGRIYHCVFSNDQIKIQNDKGIILAATYGESTGLLGSSKDDSKVVDLKLFKVLLETSADILGIDW